MTSELISYEEIRAKKIEEYGTQFKDWIWILVKQYKDRTHFLFELLQNAEDEGATHVRLFLEKNQFVIEHDGNPFSKEDVISITKVAKSTKNGPESGTIGKFGIGFKSVYAYTSVPRIYSESYAFEIRDFIFPFGIEKKQIKDNYTRIEIPFDRNEVTPEKAFLEIARALKEQISAETLLFLNNIERIDIDIQKHSNIIEITKEERFLEKNHNFIEVNLLYQKTGRKTGIVAEEKTDDYLLITDNEKDAVKLAFKVSQKDSSKELVPVKNTNIFTFFPTDKESHQSFYIHAPFDTTPARDNIVEDSERNVRFIKNICMMLRGGYCWMRDNGYLSISGLNATFPVYEYPENTLFRAIYDEAIRIIQSDEVILPTNNPRVFKKKTEIIIPDNKRIVEIFPDEDMQYLFHNRKMFWIAKEVSTDAYQPFREFLKRHFVFKTYSWPEIIRRLRQETRFLELKDRKWFSDFFSAINGAYISNEVKLQDIPLVRLSTGKQICAYEGQVPNVYLNNPEGIENKIDHEFLEDFTIKNFYFHSLKIPDYDIARIVTDEIMPKYSEKNRIRFESNNHIRENIQDLRKIKTAMMADPSIIKKISGCYILTDGKDWYRPSEIHISNSFGNKPEYMLVKDICNLKFLASEYTGDIMINDEKFFVSLGCPSSLAKISISQTQYLSYVRKYISPDAANEIQKRIFSKKNHQGIEWNTVFEGFPKVFDSVDRQKSLKIADFLNKVCANISISGEIYAADDKGFIGKSADSMTVFSAMGMMIAYIPWVYNKEGVKVAVASIHSGDLDDDYKRHMPLLIKRLPFKAEDQAVEEILSRVEDIQQKEALKTLLSDPEKLKEYAKAVHAQQLKELKKKQKKTPEEILREMGKRNKDTSGHNTEESPVPEAVANVERRAKKLEQEFAESMDQKTTLKLSALKYTYQDRIDPEEKNFLKEMYGGFCQICGEHIEKYDGTIYFEAVNVLKTAMMDERYKEALRLGWNSLCLCPNCAAKYKYGTKDLSEFEDQINSIEIESGEEDYIYLQIGMQHKDVKIKYTPKHFLALQTALRVFKG